MTECVKDVVRGHRSQNNVDINSFPIEEAYLEHSIRLRYLVALLRIADELDNDFRRAPKMTKKIKGIHSNMAN